MRLKLRGEIDVYTLGALRDALSWADDRAVVDLSDVTLLTAAAITELIRLRKRLGCGKVALVNTPPPIMRSLTILGLIEVLGATTGNAAGTEVEAAA